MRSPMRTLGCIHKGLWSQLSPWRGRQKGEVEQVSLTLKQNTQNPRGTGMLREREISAAIGQQLSPALTNWILSNPQENKLKDQMSLIN